MCQRVLKNNYSYIADSGICIRSLWFPNCGDITHICNIQDTNASADMNFARHRQNQEKEKLQLLNWFLLFENFSTGFNYIVLIIYTISIC